MGIFFLTDYGTGLFHHVDLWGKIEMSSIRKMHACPVYLRKSLISSLNRFRHFQNRFRQNRFRHFQNFDIEIFKNVILNFSKI